MHGSVLQLFLGGVDISEVPRCDLLWQMSSQWGSQKLLRGLLSHELTVYLSVFCFWRKLNNFESHSSLKLSFTNIRGLRSNFVKCESSFNQILLIFLLYVRQTWLSWFWQFLCKRLPSFNLKGFCYSSQFMWSKDFLLHGPTTYRENSPDCYLCFRLALFRSMSYFFFLHRSHSSSLCTIFDAIS